MGTGDGRLVGTDVGADVGAGEGAGDGSGVGALVGSEDGTGVGYGVTVGTGDGIDDGTAVGTCDGSGERVKHSMFLSYGSVPSTKSIVQPESHVESSNRVSVLKPWAERESTAASRASLLDQYSTQCPPRNSLLCAYPMHSWLTAHWCSHANRSTENCSVGVCTFGGCFEF